MPGHYRGGEVESRAHRRIVGETSGVCLSRPGRPGSPGARSLPLGHALARRLEPQSRAWQARPSRFGEGFVTSNPPSAQAAPPRGLPRAVPVQGLRCFVSPVALAPWALLLVPNARRSTWLFQCGGPRLGERRGVAPGQASRPRSSRPPQRDSGRSPKGRLRAVRGLLDHGEQPHAPLAVGASENVHRCDAS